jgi:hypothetical protein
VSGGVLLRPAVSSYTDQVGGVQFAGLGVISSSEGDGGLFRGRTFRNESENPKKRRIHVPRQSKARIGLDEPGGVPVRTPPFVSPCPVEIGAEALWMPRGLAGAAEARLERFGPRWLPEHPAWSHLRDWWLVHKRWANTPNWDLAVGCTVEGRPGLVLVEAKANHRELNPTGKRLRKESSSRSTDNHKRIGEAIQEANLGWRPIDGRVNISRDSHYQLANRLAFTWKLGTLGIPVVLVYLGFTGDEGIRDVGPPFADEEDWRWALSTYLEGVWPPDLLEKRIDLGTGSGVGDIEKQAGPERVPAPTIWAKLAWRRSRRDPGFSGRVPWWPERLDRGSEMKLEWRFDQEDIAGVRDLVERMSGDFLVQGGSLETSPGRRRRT